MKVINSLVYIDLEIIEIDVSVGLTGIKKSLYSSFNYLINCLMGKLMSKNQELFITTICTRRNSNFYKMLIVISISWKCALKLEF